jgi:hypothetical protein
MFLALRPTELSLRQCFWLFDHGRYACDDRRRVLKYPVTHYFRYSSIVRLTHRVLVIDDSKILREGLVGLMQFKPDIEVTGQASNARQSIELAEQLQPEVIVMDVNPGDMSGVSATKLSTDSEVGRVAAK